MIWPRPERDFLGQVLAPLWLLDMSWGVIFAPKWGLPRCAGKGKLRVDGVGIISMKVCISMQKYSPEINFAMNLHIWTLALSGYIFFGTNLKLENHVA